MSVSKTSVKHTKEIIYFHGENINSKSFQKKINRRHSLIPVVLANAMIIIGLVLTVAIIASLGG